MMKTTELKTEFYNIKKLWYNDLILTKMLKDIYFKGSQVEHFRDVAILSNNKLNKTAMRCLTFSNIDFLKKIFFNPNYDNTFLNNDSNFYCSVARVYRLPLFKFGAGRSIETQDFYTNKFMDYIYRYDLFFDFDIDINIKSDYKLLVEDVEKMIQIIFDYNLIAEVAFSGNRGFRILIYNNDYTFEEAIRIQRNIRLSSKLSFKTLDNSGYFIPSKLMKVNYSIAFNQKNKNIGVSIPITFFNMKKILNTIKELENFNIFYLNPNNIEDNITAWQKEIFFTEDSFFYNTKPQTQRLDKFIKDYNLLEVL